MIMVIKQEIEIEIALKNKIKFICGFYNTYLYDIQQYLLYFKGIIDYSNIELKSINNQFVDNEDLKNCINNRIIDQL